jgi:hypothetical protein
MYVSGKRGAASSGGFTAAAQARGTAVDGSCLLFFLFDVFDLFY